MKIQKVSRTEPEQAPYKIWNAFVNLLWTAAYQELSPEQRPAQLVIKYEGEVQNGGHLQYFENQGVDHLDATIAALGALGAVSQQDILRDAAFLWRNRARARLQTVEMFCETAREGEFAGLDARFHQCAPSLARHLALHLAAHQANYIRVE